MTILSAAVNSTLESATSTRWRSGISCHCGSSSNGSLASTTPSSRRSTNRVSPQVVASSRDPLAAKMFSRALGSAAATSDDGVAECVEAAVEDQRRQQRAVVGRLGRRRRRQHRRGRPGRCAKAANCPSVNGADADGSIGMPTLADRTAATTQPLRSAGATDANDASPHSGAALRQRRGHAVRRRTRRPSRRRSSGRASADAVHTTAPAGRTAGRAPATRPSAAHPSQPR